MMRGQSMLVLAQMDVFSDALLNPPYHSSLPGPVSAYHPCCHSPVPLHASGLFLPPVCCKELMQACSYRVLCTRGTWHGRTSGPFPLFSYSFLWLSTLGFMEVSLWPWHFL